MVLWDLGVQPVRRFHWAHLGLWVPLDQKVLKVRLDRLVRLARLVPLVQGVHLDLCIRPDRQARLAPWGLPDRLVRMLL